MMTAQDLIHELGYAREGNRWHVGQTGEAAVAHLLKAAGRAGVIGSYRYQSSTGAFTDAQLRPAVQIAEADTAEQARRIHKSLWNLKDAPFLIVVLPNQIRVYSTFSYDTVREDEGLLIEASPTLNDVREKLTYLYADDIDSGRIWPALLPKLKPEQRVDRRLLASLNALAKHLVQKHQLRQQTAHALIGKYIYIRYLRDRSIISDEWLESHGLKLEHALGRNATLAGLRALTNALETRFRGHLFPVTLVGPDAPSDADVRFVASTFLGDDPASGQLSFDFQVYDFSFIPIETLSAIYEQFLHIRKEGKAVGAYYTPESLADYLLSEAGRSTNISSKTTFLDPACGSGIFLVLAYRRLIECELGARQKAKLAPQELSDILATHIYGVERTLEACYVAQFSLILTLLSYVEPPELHKNASFTFPELFNRNIVHSDFFDPDLVARLPKPLFDIIIGNPPWVKLKSNIQRERFVLSFIEKANEDGASVTELRACEAFMWQVLKFIDTGGTVALVIQASILFNERSRPFREAFFNKVATKRVTNFSNFAYRLFPSAEAPAVTIVYGKRTDNSEPTDILHYGPFVNNQVTLRNSANDFGAPYLTIYENEIQMVTDAEVKTGDQLTWKLALWGSHRDKKAMARLSKLLPTTVETEVKKRKWALRNGLQLRSLSTSDASTITEVQELSSVPILDTDAVRKSPFRFEIGAEYCKPVPEDERFVRTRSGRAGVKVAFAPHLYITPEFAIYSDADFVLPHAQTGLSATKGREAEMRAISVLLSSSLLQYYQFFSSSSWGIFTTTTSPATVRRIRLPELSSELVEGLADLHRDLVRLEQEQAVTQRGLFDNHSEPLIGSKRYEALQDYLDDRIHELLRVPSGIQILVRDFTRQRYRFNKGKTDTTSKLDVGAPELLRYARCLRGELAAFTGRQFKVTLQRAGDYIACGVKLTTGTRGTRGEGIEILKDSSFSHMFDGLLEQQSQWVYVQRGLRLYMPDSVTIYKAPRPVDWSMTEALLDSDDIIAESASGLVLT